MRLRIWVVALTIAAIFVAQFVFVGDFIRMMEGVLKVDLSSAVAVLSNQSASSGGLNFNDSNLSLYKTPYDGNETLLYSKLESNDFEGDAFCVSWETEMDAWWTHQPEWDVTYEDDVRLCFHKFDDEVSRHNRKIYNNQWNESCNTVYTRFMWSSGWGADFTNVVDGMLHAIDMKRPLAIMNVRRRPWWHYAAVKKDGSNPTCKARDMSCYFLPLGRCKPVFRGADRSYVKSQPHFARHSRKTYHYVTRPQQWLRKSVYDFAKAEESRLTQPCSIIHVRRADVVLHSRSSRKYFPVSAYLDKLPDDRKKDGATVFLLTDDANAIDEAEEFFPNIDWRYLNRTRHRGVEGGWENQTPSKSPKQEVIIILATFRLVQRCDVLVHGSGKFSDELFKAMQESNKQARKYTVDRGRSIYSASHNISHLELEEQLNRQRQQRNQSAAGGKKRRRLSHRGPDVFRRQYY